MHFILNSPSSLSFAGSDKLGPESALLCWDVRQVDVTAMWHEGHPRISPLCVIPRSAESDRWMTRPHCQAHKSVNVAKWHPAFGNDNPDCNLKLLPSSCNKRFLWFMGVGKRLIGLRKQAGCHFFCLTVSVLKHWFVAVLGVFFYVDILNTNMI